ncbi:uncharacterized protein BDZ99DRAFT_516476 [Mytilinidion resinicola]|uniref:Uncharacterized protein n=1 Tax=Mytilinidion resinicola TaxID=574789 RepID=A0A6A6Z0N6_9PEZI|nr:uncharacterized protein BDZ99DRAFT_516476 [Mytilinidion resinicola]KAF2813834.1 hypothetical protein BDZ99DRAFT_516476 [Mytilinidion resinicola]
MAPTAGRPKAVAPKVKAAGGVKKGPTGRKSKKASGAMAAMQKYFKEHREEFPGMTFKEQQKELGKMVRYVIEFL